MKFANKQVSGIDMASKKFDVCFKEKNDNGKNVVKGTKTFNNDIDGFAAYLLWANKRKKGNALVHIVEATGVYHENLCYFLFENGEKVSVQLAQKAKYFIKSLNIKTKTDKVDASSLAEMGLSRKLDLWEPISKDFKDIRDLSRTLVRLKKQKNVTTSQIHASKAAHKNHEASVAILEELLDKQKELIKVCGEEIDKLVSKDEELSQRIEKIAAIKGINQITVVKLIAETDGFRNVNSIRSLVSYAGLDAVHNESGQHKGETRISKKGNSYIRTALYMPAMSAVQHDPKSKRTYERLNERLPKKRQSLIAVMRKLLITIYTLWKNGDEYDPNHHWKKEKRDLSPVAG